MENHLCTCCPIPRKYLSLRALNKHRRKYDPSYDRSLQHISDKRHRDYYEDPLICATCVSIISYERYTQGYSKKFCSRSCSARYNNHIRAGGKVETIPAAQGNQRTAPTFTPKAEEPFPACSECQKLLKSRKSRFCGAQCHHDFKWRLKKSDPTTVWSDRTLKRLLLERHGNQCQKCYRTEWDGVPIPIELEHIDGNSDNNSPDNVTLLCPNCHALTPTYKGRNMGNGRAFRRDRYAAGKSY